MGTLGTIAINVAANMVDLQKGLDQASGMIKSFADTIGAGGIAGSVLGSASAIGAATASFGVIAASLKSGVDHAKELQAVGRRIGADAGTAFTLERFSGSGQLEELAAGVQHLQAQLGQAAMGSADAQKHFEGLGLSWKDLLDTDVNGQLRIVADRMAEVSTQAERAAILTQAFGKAGKDLGPTLDKIGKDKGRKTDVTPLEANLAGDAGKDFGEVKKQVGQFMDDFGIRAAAVGKVFWENLKTGFGGEGPDDIIQGFRNQYADAARAQKGQAAAAAELQMAQAVNETLEGLKEQAKYAGMTTLEIAEQKKLQELRDKGAGPERLEDVRQGFQQVQKGLDRKQFDAFTASVEHQAQEIDRAQQLVIKYGIAWSEALSRAKQEMDAADLGRKAGATPEELKKAAELQKENQQRLKDQGFAEQIHNQFADPFETFQKTVKQLQDVFDKGLIDAREFADASKAAFDKMAGQDKGLPPALIAGSKEAIQMQNQMENLANGAAARQNAIDAARNQPPPLPQPPPALPPPPDPNAVAAAAAAAAAAAQMGPRPEEARPAPGDERLERSEGNDLLKKIAEQGKDSVDKQKAMIDALRDLIRAVEKISAVKPVAM